MWDQAIEIRECQHFGNRALYTAETLSKLVRRQDAEIQVLTTLGSQLFQDVQQSEEYIHTLRQVIKQAGIEVPPPPKADAKADRDA